MSGSSQREEELFAAALALPVAVLLALSNYLAACVLVDVMGRLARTGTGRLALFALGLALLLIGTGNGIWHHRRTAPR